MGLNHEKGHMGLNHEKKNSGAGKSHDTIVP